MSIAMRCRPILPLPSRPVTRGRPEPPPPESIHRIAFLGTPSLAIVTLDALVESGRGAGHEVALVVSAGDKRRGRGPELSPSPVKARAQELGLDVTDDPNALLEEVPPIDLAVVVAYGRLIRPPLLEAIPFVNLHVSLLPRWRGAAPIERAILAGDETTGVCVMEITEGLDEGGVYARAETPIGDKTVDDLRSELVADGTRLLLACLSDGFGPAVAQTGAITYATKIQSSERRLDWTLPAIQAARVVRVGGAYTTLAGKRLKIHRAWPTRTAQGVSLTAGEVAAANGAVLVGCGEGALALETVQVEGRAAIDAATWLRNAGLALDDRLGS